jgi:cytochrome c oxidase subunit 2
VLAFQDPLGQLPPAASTFAKDVDGVYYLSLGICAFFFFLILGILLYSLVKFRRRTPDQPPASMTTHNTALEVTWTVIPLIVVMVLFAWGVRGSLDMTVAPADALQYQVIGKQWDWQIYHPDSTMASANEMWVPLGAAVKVTTHSNDVLHSFYVPAFRTKRDLLPGRYQMVWFRATKLSPKDADGKSIGFPILCAEYCGTNHSYMTGRVHVVTQEEYDQKPWEVIPTDPIELGHWVWDTRCKACHTDDGSPRIGPSFKGLWGREERLADGSTVTVDADYIHESIRNPSAKIVAGYEGQNMSVFTEQDLPDSMIDGVIAWLQSDQMK